ncbi:MAG: RsbRD N-terminal domain-containing protein [Deltaproteobacteria bacterium]|jgi:hypothetical protein|nr:RsbRD N-terminal domain-containing protein [Deltaproteobacteria bacterium]
MLASKKKAIAGKWIEAVLDTYGSPGFFKKQKDRFANPIGATISEGLQELYDVLVENRELAEAAAPLESIIKMRAVQDFTPSKAVSFVFLLKHIVHQEMAGEADGERVRKGLAALDARLDRVALMAFDLYMECRERLHRIRVNEVLSGRSALTDGTKCVSAMLREEKAETAENNQINRLT